MREFLTVFASPEGKETLEFAEQMYREDREESARSVLAAARGEQ